MDSDHQYARCFTNYQLAISKFNTSIANLGKQGKWVVLSDNFCNLISRYKLISWIK